MTTLAAGVDVTAAQPLVRVVACGSVDDGKSTLIGRLLAETGSVPDDQIEHARLTRRGGSIVPAGQVDYSLLTDGLEAEHEQGITIDVAYRHMYLPTSRRVIFADAPGHEQYTRNMAVAASTADLAILLVDATRGIRPQTYRHLTVCALMGVRTIVAAVNKMDAVGYDEALFAMLADGVRSGADAVGITDVVSIPVSALVGDNVTMPSSRMTWYGGPTVLDALSTWQPGDEQRPQPLRLPVQYVVRADGVRAYAGTVVAGAVRAGDRVTVAGTSLDARVQRVLSNGADVDTATVGDAVTVTLTPELDITRGDLVVSADVSDGEAGRLEPATAFSADLVWMAEEPLAHGRSYLLVAGARTVPAVVTTVRSRRDVVTGEELAARVLGMNDIGLVEVTTDAPVALDGYASCRDTGGFILVDRVTTHTVAVGMVRHALRRGRNVVPHDYAVDRTARARLKGQRPRVLWLTGLPGAGKSTIADALERRLHAMGLHTYVLDGDNVRSGLNRDLGFTPEDRAENVRRVAECAHLLVDAGLIVIVALVSPFRSDRRAARALFDDGDFVEVWIDTPVEVCQARDPKGLYAQATRGVLPNMTGVGQSYEIPDNAEIVVHGTDPLDGVVDRLVAVVEGV